MRQMMSGLVAAAALVTVGAAPALACGGGGLFGSSCSPCGGAYVSRCGGGSYGYGGGYGGAYYGGGYGGGYGSYSGYGYGGVSHYQILPQQSAQYYYANQGPVYSGAGSFAPYPSYQDTAVSGWSGYARGYETGYDGGPYSSATTHYSDVGYGGPAIYSYRPRPAYRSWRPRPSYHASQVGYGYRSQRFSGPRMTYAPRYGVARHQHARPLRRLY